MAVLYHQGFEGKAGSWRYVFSHHVLDSAQQFRTGASTTALTHKTLLLFRPLGHTESPEFPEIAIATQRGKSLPSRLCWKKSASETSQEKAKTIVSISVHKVEPFLINFFHSV